MNMNQMEQNLNDLILLLSIVSDCEHCREKYRELRIKM